MTTRINLLPWREIRRREKDRQLLTASIGTWVLMAVVVFYAQWYMNDLIDHQKNRNSFLRSEIGKLDKQIKEIEDLKRRREALLARMEIIQRLQSDRTKIVHVFDDLVRNLPKGVYLTQFTKKKNAMALEGFAQSNARVSALMNSLDASDWFTNPNLNVINVTPQGGSRVSKFSLKVREESKSDKKKGNAEQG
jgi:type IV pilus assembly protein PilN